MNFLVYITAKGIVEIEARDEQEATTLVSDMRKDAWLSKMSWEYDAQRVKSLDELIREREGRSNV